jgi:predicted ATP-grasp superfamily ATP-dependent carboligase
MTSNNGSAPRGKILLLDGRALSTLSFTRTFGSNGHTVHIGESFKYNLSSFSKYSDGRKVYPSPKDHKREFKRCILDMIDKEDYDYVIPFRDSTTNIISSMKEYIPNSTNLILSDFHKIEMMSNKKKCMKFSEKMGIPIPTTYYPLEEGIDDISHKADFPVLVKPVESAGARGIVRVEKPSDLAEEYHSVKRKNGAAIIQEFIDHSGGHFSLGTVFDQNSDPKAIHLYEELVQYPDSGGPAIEAISIDIEPWVHDFLTLLEELNWVGPAHMDILFDPDDQKYKLLEVNPRIWMSIGLGIESGVDFPSIMRGIMDGEELEIVDTYNTNTRYRWVLPNQLLWAMSGTSKRQRIKEILARRKQPVCYGTLSLSDPHAVAGVAAQSLYFLQDGDMREIIFNRGW